MKPDNDPNTPDSAPAPDEVTLGAYVAQVLARKQASGEVGPSRLATLRRHLRRAEALLGRDTPVRAIDSQGIRRYAEHLFIYDGPGGDGMSVGGLLRYLQSLRSLFRSAEEDGLLDRNPVDLRLLRSWAQGWREVRHLRVRRPSVPGAKARPTGTQAQPPRPITKSARDECVRRERWRSLAGGSPAGGIDGTPP